MFLNTPDNTKQPTLHTPRSLQSDKHCFALNCFKTGLFTEVEWDLYNDNHAWNLKEYPDVQVDGFIYLRTKPETCLERSKLRGRTEEGSLTLEYVKCQEPHAR